MKMFKDIYKAPFERGKQPSPNRIGFTRTDRQEQHFVGDSGEFSRKGAASGHCQRSDILYREGLSLQLSWEESVKYQRCQVPLKPSSPLQK